VFPKLRTAIFIFFIAFGLRTAAQTTTGTKTGVETQQPPSSPDSKQETIGNRVEKYLRNVYAWGPSFELKIGTIKPSPIPELLEVPLTVSKDGQSDDATVYVTKDGHYIFRGDLTDMTVDPLADIRSKLHPGNSPSLGPDNAKVTLIEFADFECPSCRQLDRILRDFLPSHPDVRLVFKNFPLTEIHHWAMTAAIAGQCTYQQDPAKFWKIHDAIFDAQDVISPSNVWDKMIDLATQVGLNMDTFRTCMASPEAAHQVEETLEEGHAANITGTPTTFVNGRRFVGPDKSLLDQLSQFEGALK
jgi:protein-disulfide isomerase